VKNDWLPSGLLSILSGLCLAIPANATQLQSWQFNETQNQLTFSTDEPVQPRVQLVGDPTRLIIDLPGTSFQRSRIRESGEGSIRRIEIRELEDDLTRITIELEDDYTIDPQQVRVQGSNPTTWVVQLPTPQRITRRTRPSESDVVISVPAPEAELTRIDAVELSEDGRQVVIRANRAITDYSSGWDRSTATYQIRIPEAQLAAGLSSPTLPANGSLLQLRLRQDDQTVVVAVQPAAGVQIGPVSAPEQQALTLTLVGRPLRRLTQPATPPVSTLPDLDNLPNVADRRVLITIDPGHGGRDPGAVGIGNIYEKEIVLDISLQVAELLERQGARVLLTRRDDREIDLEPRVQVANRANANIFVSIHANAISMSRPDVNGVETYYYSSVAGRTLAEAIQNSMLEATNMNNRGVKEARFYVLRRTRMPAALVEVGFVTGREDAALLADPAFRQRMAAAIARGILQYVVQHL